MAEAVTEETVLPTAGASFVVAEIDHYFEVMWNQEPAPQINCREVPSDIFSGDRQF